MGCCSQPSDFASLNNNVTYLTIISTRICVGDDLRDNGPNPAELAVHNGAIAGQFENITKLNEELRSIRRRRQRHEFCDP